MITPLSRVILLGCVISTTCETFLVKNTLEKTSHRHVYPLNIQFKTQYGKRPHGTSYYKRYGSSYLQELTHERCRLYKDKVLKDARMLFIRNLDVEITSDALDNFFHYVFGPLTSKTNMVMDPNTGRHKGYGYIKFSTPDIASRVLLTLNGTRLGDKRVYFSDVLFELTKKPEKDKENKESYKKRRGIDDYRVPFVPIN